MNAASVLKFSLICEGAACGLFLMMAGVMWRDRRADPARLLGVALAIGAAGSALNLGFDFRPANAWWQVPIHALAWGGAATFLLWAWSSFDDEFVLRPWHALLWLALAGGGVLGTYGGAIWPVTARVIETVLPFIILALVFLAAAQTLATWRADLVARRRQLRSAVLAGTVIYIVFDTVSGLFLSAQPGSSYRAAQAVGLCALAVVAGWRLFRTSEDGDSTIEASARFDTIPVKTQTPAAQAPAAVDPVLLQRLDRLMAEERVYRQELTIGALAAKLRIQEYRLRQVINEGLGHRNFNAFLNSYRIIEAKAALADPDQIQVPILTIAMDAGFQSLGPFNRAFKADTGSTPTEFRRDVLNRLSDSESVAKAKTG